jgi:hypothetical protein
MSSPAQALTVVGEDLLCCELGVQLAAQALPLWQVAPAPIDAGGVTRLAAAIPRYSAAARHGSPLLCIADSDRQCPLDWLDRNLGRKLRHRRLVLRLAVPEAEGWVLADHDGMTQHFRAPARKLPVAPDAVADPKREFMRLVQAYAPAAIRREMIAKAKSGELKRASGYNVHLRLFALQTWNPERAAQRSESLMRALQRLRAWPAAMGAAQL